MTSEESAPMTPNDRTVPAQPPVPLASGIADPGIEYIWHDSPVPAWLPVTQVYGWLICPFTGRVLIQEHDDGVHTLNGGTPAPFDAAHDATLAREAFEENTVRIAPSAAYLGYQEVRQPGRTVIAQVRMAGIITEFAARAPDPDNGRLNRRYMTSLAAAPGVLGWGQPAEAQARAAADAGRRWGLPVDRPAAAGYED